MRNVENILETDFSVSNSDYTENYIKASKSDSDDLIDNLLYLNQFKLKSNPIEKSWGEFKKRIATSS
jgi:hypothetical protein